MESLGIDLVKPHESLEQVVPDGNIHAFKGKLKVVSLSSSKPLIDTAKVIISQMRKNPKLFGMKNDEASIKELKSVEDMSDLILKIPAPPSFLLSLSDGKSVYGPVIESSVRLPLVDQALIFGSSLPFEWTVVGYLYPTENDVPLQNDGFLFQMSNVVSSMREYINPKTGAIMIPILILR